MRTARVIVAFAAAVATVTVGAAANATAPPTSEPADSAAGDLSAEEAAVFEIESEFAKCMRDNGADGFPDPQVDDNGFILVGVVADPNDAAMNAAHEACQHIFEGGGPPATGVEAAWERVVPGGDCECADGSEFAFWERRADPTKVVLFLEGGGACWNAEMCAFVEDEEAAFYSWNIARDDPAGNTSGIFDRSNPDNPFADYSFVFVPYCTGDVHLGDATRSYSPDLTVEHNGYVNGTTALAHLVERYPDAAHVAVIGESAGSVAAPVYGGLASDLLPDARVTVLADSSAAYPDDPDVNAEILGEQWGAFDTMPDWPANDGLTASDWGPPRFWVQTGLHDPAIELARFDHAYDDVQEFFMEQLGADASDLMAAIDANEEAIEAAGVVQHSYTAPGTDHGVVADDSFYTTEVDGVLLVDWTAALINGDPLDDVHCEQCEGG